MNSLEWQDLYKSFSRFAYQARKQNFYPQAIREMEQSLYRMCPCKQLKEMIDDEKR